MPKPDDLAARLQSLLDERGLSIAEVAREAGMAKQQLHAILSGKNPNPGVLTVQRIASAIGVTLAELFGAGDEP